MWYRFEKGESKGKLRVKRVQIAWYDMKQNGDCFDEDFVLPKDNDVKTLESIGTILPYVETVEDKNKMDRSRIFVHMDNGDVYELKMEKLSKKQFKKCNNFYGK